MHISEDLMKDLPSYGYRYLDMSKSLINWYQWEYTHYMHYQGEQYKNYIDAKKHDTFCMIHQGFEQLFEEHKTVLPCCYRGICCYTFFYEDMMKKTIEDINRKNLTFDRYYSGSLSSEVSEKYIDYYLRELLEIYIKHGFRFANDELIAIAVLFEIHNATVFNLTEYNTHDYQVLDDEVIIKPCSYKVIDKKFDLRKIVNAQVANYYVVLEADPEF